MTTPDVAARLKYLSDAAHLLVAHSHSTSSYLMSRCNSLMFDNDLEQPATHRRTVCNACGNIMLLDDTATIDVNGNMAGQKRRRSGKQKGRGAMADHRAKSVTFKCQPCGRYTQYMVDTPKPKAVRSKQCLERPAATHPVSLPSTPSRPPGSGPELAVNPSANASSKKRAKSRKQGGLQALLAKNREAALRGPSNGFGLDLMDLMKGS